MDWLPKTRPCAVGAAQVALAPLLLAALSFIATDSVALIALDGRDAGRLAAPAIAEGGAILGRGNSSNILIIRGKPSQYLLPMLAQGVIALPAPAAGCSERGLR